MKQINVINSLTVAGLLAAIFGDENTSPVQIKLQRNKVAEKTGRWAWSVSLPLKNGEVENLFESLILRSLQVTNDELPATLTITACATNVGYEPCFQLINCTFLKRGVRRLRRAFTETMERWEAARGCVACAWEVGGLQIQTELKAIQLSQCDSPGLVHSLQVRMRPVNSQKGLLAIIKAQSEDALVFFDFDRSLAESGFRSAVQQKLEDYLRNLIKKGMAECLDQIQEEVVGYHPTILLKTLLELGEQRERVEEAGIPITFNHLLPELISRLQEYLDYKKQAEKPGIPITFNVYRSGALVGKHTLSNKVIKIGRTPGDNVVPLQVKDTFIPGIHSVIEQSCGRICLIDLATELPTFVNGEPVPGKRNLHSGDQIGVGDLFTIKVEFQETATDDVPAQEAFAAPDPETASSQFDNQPA